MLNWLLYALWVPDGGSWPCALLRPEPPFIELFYVIGNLLSLFGLADIWVFYLYPAMECVAAIISE